MDLASVERHYNDKIDIICNKKLFSGYVDIIIEQPILKYPEIFAKIFTINELTTISIYNEGDSCRIKCFYDFVKLQINYNNIMDCCIIANTWLSNCLQQKLISGYSIIYEGECFNFTNNYHINRYNLKNYGCFRTTKNNISINSLIFNNLTNNKTKELFQKYSSDSYSGNVIFTKLNENLSKKKLNFFFKKCVIIILYQMRRTQVKTWRFIRNNFMAVRKSLISSNGDRKRVSMLDITLFVSF
ncbi:hypothetical protein ACJA25_00415 [Mycoplasmopsis hyopharyngis]|uniref:hypothetical protein n=1 Tax=Mycoplasmopsis hyopharyngis TaxID=29558 RepID=UPI003872D2AD